MGHLENPKKYTLGPKIIPGLRRIKKSEKKSIKKSERAELIVHLKKATNE